MSLNNRIQVIHFKKEAVYGTPETLINTDAVEFLRGTVNLTALDGSTVVIDLARPDIDESTEFHVGKRATIAFDILCDGAGTAVDTAPQWTDLIEACATSQTINVATDVDHDPVSASMDSGTLKFNAAGQEHVLAGCRGNCELLWQINAVAMMRFTFWGFYTDPSSVAATAVDYTGWQAGIVADAAAFGTTTLHGQTLNVTQVNFNMNNNLYLHATSEGDEIVITRRAARIDLLYEKLAYSVFNPYAIATAHTLAAFSSSITGGAAGRVVALSGSNVQLMQPREEDVEDIAMTRVNLKMISTAAGNDNFQIKTS